MALPSQTFDEVKAMSPRGRTSYFETYGRYFSEALRFHYAIRVGSRTLFSNDKHDLREQFDNLLRYGMTWKGKGRTA